MGQAWCKEKSDKAQDSKSPLDRVFVRCAHKIYPGLKDDSSCLGAQEHKVTSTPRKQLQRGQSIDSVDRPFHPSEWVDVNLEVACEPLDSALFDAANRRSSTYLARLNGVNSSATRGFVVAPVPPPRRRRRRRPIIRSQNKDDNGFDAGNNAATTTTRSSDSIDELDDATRDSDDEFVELERSLHQLRASPSPRTRPKKTRSTTSLPQLPEEENEEEAKRPPRHAKAASLPRDSSLSVHRQSPERLFNSDQRIDEATATAAGDNSIFKIDQIDNVKTSTPVKAPPHEELPPSSSFNFHDLFLSCDDRSSKSRDSSSQQQQQQQEPSASNGGYESRSSHLFAERSNDDEQLSSGILGDALVEPSIELPDDEVVIVVVQRSLSDESLPHEMLIEEIEDDEAEVIGDKAKFQKDVKDEKPDIPRQSCEFAKQSSVEDSFKTPPPSPELKLNQPIVQNGIHKETMQSEQLEVAVHDHVDEKEKSPEPRIIPVTRDHRDAAVIIDEENNSSARLIDLHHRRDRRNPFDDLSNVEIDLTDIAPEKPSRLHQRSSLMEESAIEASLIVPTPPRRRHRNHQRSSNLDDRQYNDRLI